MGRNARRRAEGRRVTLTRHILLSEYQRHADECACNPAWFNMLSMYVAMIRLREFDATNTTWHGVELSA